MLTIESRRYRLNIYPQYSELNRVDKKQLREAILTDRKYAPETLYAKMHGAIGIDEYELKLFTREFARVGINIQYNGNN